MNFHLWKNVVRLITNANDENSQVHNRGPRVSLRLLNPTWLVQGLILWRAPLRLKLKNKKTRTQWRKRNETLLFWQSSFKQNEKHEVKHGRTENQEIRNRTGAGTRIGTGTVTGVNWETVRRLFGVKSLSVKTCFHNFTDRDFAQLKLLRPSLFFLRFLSNAFSDFGSVGRKKKKKRKNKIGKGVRS